MHVAFLMQDTGALYGAERATLDLAEGLKRTGELEVSFLLIRELRMPSLRSPLQEAIRDAGIACTLLPARGRLCWSLVRAVRSHVRNHGVDCLHVIGYKAAVHGALAVRSGKLIPWVSTIHGWLDRPQFKERLFDWIELQFVKRAQQVVVLSKYYRDRLIDGGVRSDRIRWIPSGLQLHTLDVDESSVPFGRNDSPPTVGILGRLSSEKNHGMFLQVARRLLQDGVDIRFLIAGEGPERANIDSVIRQWGLGERVAAPGVMDRSEFFRRVDVLALCSQIENLPYVILEAMAWSRPVVATRVGGVPDLVVPEETGLLVDAQDVDGMSDAIRRLLEDKSLARSMGAAGRERVTSRFTLERSCETHVQMYRELVGQPSETPSDIRA